MPFIHTRTNRPISQEEEKSMAKQYGQAVTVLGKSESWLMVNIQPKCSLYFRGSNEEPIAFVSVTVYGKPNPTAYDALTARFNTILSRIAGIEQMYVSYSETSNFGYNGSNF